MKIARITFVLSMAILFPLIATAEPKLDPIEQLVAKLSASHGLWVNGL